MEYLYDNPDVAIRMGAEAKKRYLELFTGERMGKQYTDLYSKLIGNK